MLWCVSFSNILCHVHGNSWNFTLQEAMPTLTLVLEKKKDKTKCNSLWLIPTDLVFVVFIWYKNTLCCTMRHIPVLNLSKMLWNETEQGNFLMMTLQVCLILQCFILRGIDTMGIFSAIFSQRDNYCDFLFAFLWKTFYS